MLAALADGSGGDVGRLAVEELARVMGRDTEASAQVLAEAAGRADLREAVRAWGANVGELLASDPAAACAVAAAMERHTPGSGLAWYDGDHTDFRGGVFLDKVIGVQIVVQQTGAAAPEAMASLPPRPGGFTGREEETEKLLRVLDPVNVPATPGSVAVVVTAVSGLGGIGKTALAVEAAHLALEGGWFPGGVLCIDLHGYDQEPVTADQALQSLLRALGVPPKHIPVTADDRLTLYRSKLVERARRGGAVLLLADNASRPDQIRPLLPGDTRHRVLVTSRDRLPQLGARLVPLEQLAPEAACELLDLALRIADESDRRIADDPDGAERLAALCGHLPLALQIAAALLAEDSGMSVTELVGQLAKSRDRLDPLFDSDRSVRATFDLSYRRLPSEQARLLRLLALAPGPWVSGEVAAALIGADEPPLQDLRELARAHLVDRGSGRGRWRLHDLVRAYGMGVVAGDEVLREEGDAARERVLEFYLPWARAADERLQWLQGAVEPERFATRGQALAWCERERPALVAAAQWAREKRFAVAAVELAERIGEFLAWRRYLDDWITVTGAAKEAAQRSGNRVGEAIAWNNHGMALRRAGRVKEAIDALTCARDLHHMAGDRQREADTWNSLGIALVDVGQLGEAIDAFTRTRDLHQTTGDRNGEATAWNSLGLALGRASRAGEAIDALTYARDLWRAAGDRHGEAAAWNNLGVALWDADRRAEAVEAHGRALEIFQEFEDWYEIGQTLYNLGLAHEDTHRPGEARHHYLAADDAYTRANALDLAAQVRARAEALK
ncbi:tetratricopeptide repeat protein [Streptomyces adelaidensis]|uniref:tetratricopeptide repeat protein n=1 Tax=Streptomyces adelaidensis TaxID=2796465 RepID=UPI0027DE6561|nr:tetratricopeptide repeat protein [Streptomyces adelaidensis]